MRKLRVGRRLSTYIFLTLLFLPFVILLHLLGLHAAKMRLIRVYYRFAARSWGVRVVRIGNFDHTRPLLVVSNHSTYTDVPVLGCLAPLRFTPKAEVAGWPVIGFLCRLADCIFIDRNPRKTAENMAQLQQAMGQGAMISLFPEGTTNDGTAVLPFKSSYFSLAQQGLVVQPVTVRYAARDGSPLSPEVLRKVVWIGEDEFIPHLLDFLALSGGIQAIVTCHAPLSLAEDAAGDRKQLAQYCWQAVSGGMFADKKSAP